MSEQELGHFYNFCFVIQEAGVSRFVSGPAKIAQMNLTLPVLAGVRQALAIPEHGQMVSASYLGQMTMEEFNPNGNTGMDATNEYLEGLQVGLDNDLSKTNPYQMGTVAHLDWRNGRIQGDALREAREAKGTTNSSP